MTVDTSAALGERLRAFRTAAALTQEQLAERAGISVQAVAALENGRSRRPYPHTLRALGDALGLAATPSFVVMNAAILGYPGKKALRKIIQSAAKCGLVVCKPR